MSSILLFLSGGEIVVVLVIVLLLFGSKKIPELARGLGRGMREFKDATQGIQREIEDSMKDTNKSISEKDSKPSNGNSGASSN